MRPQKGSIFWARGRFYVQYRDWTMKDGVRARCQVAKGIPSDRSFPVEPKRIPAEIKEAAEKIVAGINADVFDPNKRLTVAGFFDNIYMIAMRSEKKLRTGTLNGYRRLFDQQLRPRIGDEMLRDVTTERAFRLFGQIAKDNPPLDPNSDYATRLKRTSLRNMKWLLASIFNQAANRGFFPDDRPNPIQRVDLPPAPPSAETHDYTQEEVDLMLLHVPEPAKTMIAVASYAGLRRSEIAGLTWGCYHMDQQDGSLATLEILSSVVDGKRGRPKTDESRGSVEVVEILRKYLDAHRARCGNPPPNWPIFATTVGTPLSPNNLLNRTILPILNRCKTCTKAEGDHTTEAHLFERDNSRPAWRGWHGFRRSLSTRLYQMNERSKDIQAVLRHSDVRTTEAHYIKAAPGSMKRFSEREAKRKEDASIQ
jgi:integrase